MDPHLHNLHLQAGQVSGREKTCGKKTPYATESLAQTAADAHNRWKERKHDVEPYPWPSAASGTSVASCRYPPSKKWPQPGAIRTNLRAAMYRLIVQHRMEMQNFRGISLC